MMIDDVRSRIKHSVLPGSAVRHCAAGVLATAGSTGLLLLLLLHFLRYVPVQVILASPATIGIDELVSVVVTGCGVLLAAWYTLSVAGGTLCAGARLLGSTWHAGERLLRRRGAPGVARLLGAGSGAVLAASLALVPAQAASPPGPDAPAAEDLSWGAEQNTAADPPAQVQQSSRATPQRISRPEGQERSRSEPPEHSRAQEQDEADTPPAHAATASTDPTGYEVRPGDTLWDIAAAHLPEGASAADIAAAWPEWYRANQAAIGADADLIFPGTTLHPPDMDTTASTSKGAT